MSNEEEAMTPESVNNAASDAELDWAQALEEQNRTEATPLAAEQGGPLGSEAAEAIGQIQQDITRVLDIPVQLSVELGRTRVPIKYILQLAQGSVVELDALAGEPMDVLVTQNSMNLDAVLHQRLLAGIVNLERNTRDLQEAVMSIRMIPMSVVFSRFPRMLRDLANKLGKQVELVTVGDATELDKGLIEKITDPLTHLVRNSCDHGIESPQERIAAGKPAQGTITLSAFQQGGSVVIEVRDDGRGLPREKLIRKAIERGLPAHDGMPDSEVWQLIFAPGFSTAEQVTDVSGRGVGMDVVKKNITALNGIRALARAGLAVGR